MIELDKVDLAILQVVQRNNRLTSEELGGLVNLSPSACQRRLKRLRAEKIIESDVSIVSPKRLGRAMTMIVLVTLERDRADIIDRFKRTIRETKDVMAGFYVTGDADFILIVTATDMDSYELFTRRFFNQNNEIKGVKTMVVLDRVKASFEFPIDIEEPISV